MTILKISFFLLKVLTSWGDGSVKLFNSRLNTALLKRKIQSKHVFKISPGEGGGGSPYVP